MGTTGLIFGAIVAAWLAYLVPSWIRKSHRPQGVAGDLSDRFSDSIRIVRDGSAPPSDDPESTAEVSTPSTRRAELASLKRRDRRAASRRRVLLIAIVVALIAVSAVAIAGLVPAWTPAIPVGLLVVFVGAARISVSSMDRQRREILEALRSGNEEKTVVLTAADLEKVAEPGSSVTEVALGAPKPAGSALWDAVPVTTPTYVQAPTPPRTVRTIDLSAPAAPAPVTADPKSATEVDEIVDAPVDGRKRASGE